MSKTTIEWTEFNWNPFLGCRHKSDGCKNCYAESIASRFSGIDKNGKVLPFSSIAEKFNKEPRWTGEVGLNETILLEPLKRKIPTAYFVNSMSDTFYSKFPDEWIDKLFAVMAACPQHTFQVLTKRADRMKEYFNVNSVVWVDRIIKTSMYFPITIGVEAKMGIVQFPLSNVWLGASIENQKTAMDRIPHLLTTPSAIRWVSAEPLLGKIDLTFIENDGYKLNCLTGRQKDMGRPCEDAPSNLNWVVVGGESGLNARPMHPDWVRSIRDQCVAANIPFFFKQWGSWFPVCELPPEGNWSIGKKKAITHTHLWDDERKNVSVKIGKKNAGRFLDGRTWDEFPENEQ